MLVITGHWEEDAFTVSAAEHPPMVYDYSGFPEDTYHIRYPAPGSPGLAAKVKSLLSNAGLPVREDSQRGFDHGTFVPLVLMYPDADVPVVMLSLKSTYDPQEHIRVGQALVSLRDEGVLIIGSGLTYLAAAVTQSDWRVRNDMLIHWENAAGARLAHPREDHLIPLMVVAGAAAEDSGRHVLVDHVLKVPMASYEFGGRS